MTLNRTTLLLALTLPLGACQATSQTAASETADAGAMLDMEAMMLRMEELGTPGMEHARLEPLVGTFRATVSFWFAPGSEPETMTGTMVNTWFLGGRFIRSDYTSEWMGQPFHGFGLLGYDKNRGVYTGTWCDSSSTILAPIGAGQANEAGNQITIEKDMLDPMSGEIDHVREVLTIVDEDHHRMEMFTGSGGPDEFKTMAIEYSRSR